MSGVGCSAQIVLAALAMSRMWGCCQENLVILDVAVVWPVQLRVWVGWQWMA